jgi:hypothetical protein
VPSIETDALNGLSTAVSSLLPAPASPALAPSLVLSSARVTPTGLGGLVGPSTSPVGEVRGRRVAAELRITVRADTGANLDAALRAHTLALMGADRVTLAQKGILRLAVDGLGTRVVPAGGGQGQSQIASCDVAVTVLYEHERAPDAPEGIIQQIPLALEQARGDDAGPLLRMEFDAQSLARFDVVDDPAATTAAPSNWVWAAAPGRIEQRSGITGGANNLPADRPGTFLVLKPTEQVPLVTDCALEAWMQAGAPGGIGVVFRWVDADNFCFFLMDSTRNERVLGRKRAGAYGPLLPPSRDAANGFQTGRGYHVRVAVRGDEVEVFLDGQRVLGTRDPTLAGPGRVGLMSRACSQAFFHGLELSRL